MLIDAKGLDYAALNKLIKNSDDDCKIENCLGQRFIADGLAKGSVTIDGIPGNALGAYLNGAQITVNGNAQDAVGDTMNDGKIVIHGSIGDTAGYAMRGGEIYVKGNAGYRAGIHMKEYRDKKPIIVIGGRTGSFLGEYQAGGIIIVLGIGSEDRQPVGNFCGTGMHGGRIYLRTAHLPKDLPEQVVAHKATEEDMQIAAPLIQNYAEKFGADAESLLHDEYYVLRPNTQNPYKQLYVTN